MDQKRDKSILSAIQRLEGVMACRDLQEMWEVDVEWLQMAHRAEQALLSDAIKLLRAELDVSEE